MIDGQGADEQLAGYGGNDLALYTGLFRQLRWTELIKEAIGYKKNKGNWPIGFLLGVLQQHLPFKFIPKKYATDQDESLQWIAYRAEEINKPYYPNNLQAGLIQQVSLQPLPSLLRYEDRNSMAFSVESRVPFMDYRLIEFTLGLPEKFIYRRGERKYILRKSFKGVVPDGILERKDKMGFVSPEERWLKEEGKEWFNKQLDTAPAAIERFVDKVGFASLLFDMQTGKRAFDFSVWRTICLNYYLKKMNHAS
jgi:asparagine synthase (glutamine-hydrolysing)